MSMQRLIINADDYGLSKSINDGTLQGFEEGVITSTSILANAPFFNQAIDKLPNNLGLGVHLNLTQGKSLLLNKNFNKNIRTKILLKQFNKEFIEQEFRLQIEKLLDLGIKPSHLDSHHNIHAFPPMKEIALNLAKEYKINKIRWPREKQPFQLTKQYLKSKLINYQIDYCPIITTKNFYGLVHVGNNSLKKLISYLDFDDSAEICVHVAQDEDHFNRKKELLNLTHPKFKEEIKKRKIKLISFNEL